MFQFLSRVTPLQLISLTLVLLLAIPQGAVAQQVPAPQTTPITVLSCRSTDQFHILPTPCNPSQPANLGQVNAIQAWESKVLADYLQDYGFPSDQNQFYSWAGKDIRDEVRGYMYDELAAVAQKPAAQRTANEQAVFDWFNAWMTYMTFQVYTAAMAEYNRYLDNPCGFTVDPTLSKAFGIQYDTLNCDSLGSLFAAPAQPSAQYYLAFGTQQVYNNLKINPVVAETLARLPAFAEIGLSSAAVGAFVPAAVVGNAAVFQAIAPYAGRVAVQLAAQVSEAGGEAASGFTAAAASAGVFAIVAVAVLILIQGAIDFSEKQQVIDGLNAFSSTYNTVTAPGYKYDLASALADANEGAHLMTVWAYLVTNSYDNPATVSPNGLFISTPGYNDTVAYYAAHNYSSINYDATFHPTSSSSNLAHSTSIDWAGRTWDIALYGDKLFLKTCISPSPAKDANNNPVHPCYGPELARSVESEYVTAYPIANFAGDNLWENYTNSAMISRTGGDKFAVKLTGDVGYHQAVQGYADCPINPSTGISDNAGVFPACSGFVDNVAYFYTGIDTSAKYDGTPPDPVVAADSTPFLYSQMSIVAAPVFSSAPNVGFLGGTAKTFHFTASSPTIPGDPVTITRGACPGDSAPPDSIPSNTTFTPGLSNAASLSYDGTAVTPGNVFGYGTYNLTVCAQLDAPSGPYTTQTVAVYYGSQTGFISPTQLTVYSGIPFSQKIYTVGDPAPSLSVQNLAINDPFHFVNFLDNGDGTATVSGTVPYPFQLLTKICIPATILGPGTCPTVTANNHATSSTAPFNVTAVTAPTPSLILPPFNFVSGIPNTATISTFNFVTTPVLSALPQGSALPLIPAAVTSDTTVKTPLANYPWLNFKDNGNGTATLSGTPPVGLNVAIPLEIESNSAWAVPAGTNITVNVAALPQFTNPDNAIFNVGQFGSTALTTANPATITAAPVALPNGVTIAGGVVAGTPSAQSAGYFPIPFTATNQYGTAQQTLNLYVMEPPALSTTVPGNPASFYVHAGAQTNIGITAVGYPKSPLTALPPPFTSGMNITMTTTNLPASAYTFAGTTDPSGKNNGSGSLKLQPTNSQVGMYTASLTAANGVAPNNTLPLTIFVVLAGDTNHDGLVNCADLTLVKNALGQRYGQAGYDIRADVNLDGIVDIRDFTFVSAHLAPGTVCH